VSALASRNGATINVMAWHYHDDELPGPDASITLQVTGISPTASVARLTHYRIDENHSNAFSLWKRMGSPQTPNDQQYAELEREGQLETIGEPQEIHIDGGQFLVTFDLPRAAVSLVVVEQIR
jgi:xylan 1,4-beta-xylosidase